MIHDHIILSAHPELVEGRLQIPPLAGARCNAPQQNTISQGKDAGHPAGASPLLTPPGNHSAIPSGRATGAAVEGPIPPSTAANPAVYAEPVEWVPVASMEAVLAERIRQIARFGHTPESDAALPLRQLPREAARFLNAAIEDVQFHREGWRQHARRHLIRAAAMILAAMDRIEAEPEQPDPFIPSVSRDQP